VAVLPQNIKRVIINADDFGEAASIDRGIIACHQAGMVKSASLLANGDNLSAALQEAAELPGLGLGIHLTLVKGKPLSAAAKIPSLIFYQGNFAQGYLQFALRYFLGGIDIRQVEYEWERQREKLGGTNLDHLDSHQHLHLLPALFNLVLKLADKWGIKFVRIPRENILLPIKQAEIMTSRTLNLFCRKAEKKLQNTKIGSSDNFFGSSFSGKMVKPVWSALWENIPPGLTEIMCHPGYEEAETRRRYGWSNDWQGELAALTDPEVTAAAVKCNIVFTNYSEIGGM